MMTRRMAVGLMAGAVGMEGRAVYGAVPSPRQLRWHEMETNAFLHFTVNTFTDKEWGYGDESPELFAPKRFDAGAIVEALDAAGMKGVILTCKHHDGFCLWPSQTTKHSVKASKWRGGKGDVVREISDAARRRGMRFGVYLSPWDRNAASYGTPQYVEMYRAQLRELLTQYGEIFEVWHDGANGGDGYYGGAREKRTIDKKTYYGWPETWELIRKWQPGAVIFSDVGPDVRWVGNEKGIAGETCWGAFEPVGRDGGAASPGDVREKESSVGHRHGSKWIPAECDVSIRPGWFWHEKENARVKTGAELVRLYYQSVGRGATLLLNVPPNRDGLLGAEDVASLRALGEYRRWTFGVDLAKGAKVLESGHGAAAVRELELKREARFSVIRLRESIQFGQRIEEVAVERWVEDGGGRWEELGRATSVGARRLIRLERPVAARRVRVKVLAAAAEPVWREVALFAESE